MLPLASPLPSAGRPILTFLQHVASHLLNNALSPLEQNLQITLSQKSKAYKSPNR